MKNINHESNTQVSSCSTSLLRDVANIESIKNKIKHLLKFLNKKRQLIQILIAAYILGLFMFLLFYFIAYQNSKLAFDDVLMATEITTKPLANVVIRDDLTYGEDCDPSKNKFCDKIEKLECSINWKCDCKMEWYFNKSVCGK